MDWVELQQKVASLTSPYSIGFGAAYGLVFRRPAAAVVAGLVVSLVWMLLLGLVGYSVYAFSLADGRDDGEGGVLLSNFATLSGIFGLQAMLAAFAAQWSVPKVLAILRIGSSGRKM